MVLAKTSIRDGSEIINEKRGTESIDKWPLFMPTLFNGPIIIFISPITSYLFCFNTHLHSVCHRGKLTWFNIPPLYDRTFFTATPQRSPSPSSFTLISAPYTSNMECIMTWLSTSMHVFKINTSFNSNNTEIHRYYSVGGITVLSHFHKNELMPIIGFLTSLIFWSLFHVIYILLCPKLILILSC